MLHHLRIGDKVKVWPRPGHTVASAPPVAVQVPVTKEVPTGVQYLAARPVGAGDTVEWTYWLHERALAGDLMFSDPGADGKKITHAKHVRHPHEIGADGKPAHEDGAHSRHELEHWVALGHEDGQLSAKALEAEEAARTKDATAEKAKAVEVVAPAAPVLASDEKGSK